MTERWLCGWRVRSGVPLPDLLPWTGDDRSPDLTIRVGAVAARLDDPALGGLVFEGPLFQAARDGTCRFAVPGVAVYRIDAAGREVVVDPTVDPAASDVRLFLLGTVFGILCLRRGLLPLHASCVRVGDRAVAFAGPSGIGKSTLAAAFLTRGHTVLADDVTVVDLNGADGPIVLPAFPRLKLWRDALDGLGLDTGGLERVRGALEKYGLPLEHAFRPEPLPLAAVYHLIEATDPRHAGLERLDGATGIAEMHHAVYRRGLMTRARQGAPILRGAARLAGQVEGFRFRRHRDLAALAAETAGILARHGAG